jgi:methionine synthase I (cobalamin-dependent)
MLARIFYAQRIMIIDGAMGTTIQQYKLQVGMYARYGICHASIPAHAVSQKTS